MAQASCGRPFLTTGTSSIDQSSFSDLLYSSATQNFQVYLYEIAEKPAGVVSFQRRRDGDLFIDLIARDIRFDAQKIGGMLMRRAETYARHASCPGITLSALEREVGFSERFFFERTQDDAIDLGAEKYVAMRRKLLYNINPKLQVSLDYLDHHAGPDGGIA